MYILYFGSSHLSGLTKEKRREQAKNEEIDFETSTETDEQT